MQIEFPHKIILASNSPRRAELLKSLNFDFEVQRFSFIETFDKNIPPEKVAENLATSKTNQIPKEKNTLYITADTVVICNNQVLGKPKNKEQAHTFLNDLQNNTHQVITGVSILVNNYQVSFSSTTEVTFHPLNKNEIENYIENYSPFDKAGSYGIQEWIGMIGIKNINGSYYSVMGLPTDLIYQELKKIKEEGI